MEYADIAVKGALQHCLNIDNGVEGPCEYAVKFDFTSHIRELTVQLQMGLELACPSFNKLSHKEHTQLSLGHFRCS